MNATGLDYNAIEMRRFEIACERERLSQHELTPDEVSRVVAATKGERLDADLYAKVVAERFRRQFEGE